MPEWKPGLRAKLMAKFETEMLADYKEKFKKLPAVWLGYIDDIFVTWDYDETS